MAITPCPRAPCPCPRTSVSMQDVGVSMQDVGVSMQDVSVSMQDVNVSMQDVGVSAACPHAFWSAGEDGLVRQYDTRAPGQRDFESSTVLVQVRGERVYLMRHEDMGVATCGEQAWEWPHVSITCKPMEQGVCTDEHM